MTRVGLLAFIVLVSLAAKGDPPVALLFVPRYLTDDTPVHFSLRIQPNPNNRKWRVEAVDELGDPIRGSDGDLPDVITHQIEWGPLPEGDYELVATVFGVNDKGEDGKPLAGAHSHVTVIGFGP